MSTRPLPSRPNLEYEHKAAKKLLADLRRGDADALARVRAQLGGGVATTPDAMKLSDAQLAITREYGFSSRPRLVDYFKTLERHERGPREFLDSSDTYEWRAQETLERQVRRHALTAQQFASFVPRFYGVSTADVLDATVTLDEARLVVARTNRCPSWESLIEQANARPERPDPWTYFDTPSIRAQRAVQSSDLAMLERIVDAHPELLHETDRDHKINNLAYSAIYHERSTRTPEARRVTDWISSRGGDVQRTLNRMLIGHPNMTVENVSFLLERGADPGWLPPNGIPVLEHMIYRCWNGAAVDQVARRVVPRRAFWIAAGLGDVRGLDRYIDRAGRLTDAARQNRPDFMAMFSHDQPTPPGANDQEIIWEAFLVAGFNSRFAVLDALLERGFPVNYSPWGTPFLNVAIGSGMVALVEYLLEHGADPEGVARGRTARAYAESAYDSDPTPDTLRILELCGARDPDSILSSFETERAKTRKPTPKLLQTLELAGKEALGRGQDSVSPDNLFLALLREWPMLP
ncbi:MAG: hypothetical protein WEE89_15620, partial [Gemmatimonadota bacterium]